MRTHPYIALLIFVTLFSCEEGLEKDLNTQSTELIVVEGLVTNKNTNHLIKLTRTYTTQNEVPSPFSGAFVAIVEDFGSSNSETFILTEFPVGSGNYYTPPMRALFGKLYLLYIYYDGKEYFGYDSPPPVEPLNDIKYVSVPTSENLFKLKFEDFGSDPYYINHFIDWSGTSSCSASVLDCTAKLVFYDLKTIDVHETYKPEKNEILFPLNTVIVREKLSVSDSYRTFLRSVLSETEWRGGIFDIDRANATTNMSEGAIGFFAASTVTSDTTVVF